MTEPTTKLQDLHDFWSVWPTASQTKCDICGVKYAQHSRSDETIDDEGPETVWLDDDDELDIWSNDYRPSDLWGRYASRASSSYAYGTPDESIERVLKAHRLLQGVVDTFAPAGERYEVTFDASIQTAATDFKNRKVGISSLPLFDPTIDFDTAGKVLMAMAVHESWHPRYGMATARAVTKKWGSERLPQRLGNLLDDVSIERAGISDYPGAEDLFPVAIDYIAKAALVRAGKTIVTPTLADPFDIAVGAIRYPAFNDWSDPAVAVERDWYIDWAERAAKVYSVPTHIAAIQEALDHIEPEAGDQPDDSDDEGEGEGSAGGLPGGDGKDEGTGGGGDDESDDAAPPDSIFPTCPVDSMRTAALANGAYSPISDSDAQEAVKNAENLQPIPGTTDRGEVFWNAKKVIRGVEALDPAIGDRASAAIRAAFNRSKSGHSATDRHLRTGSIDDRNLWRCAAKDRNIFRRHRAPSPGSFRVWLLVDTSGSMSGRPIHDATNVAVALARAVRYLPNIALDIWGWTTSATYGAAFRAIRVWTNGQAVERIGALEKSSMAGTPDSDVVRWAASAIKKAARPGEQPLLIVASDGFGYLGPTLIDEVRRSGVAIVSVAIGDLDVAAQERKYGRGNFVPWGGSILAAAKPLGQMIGRLAAGVSPR